MPESSRELLPQFDALAAKHRDKTSVILCGMGGSSLGPEVIAQTFSKKLFVLDSTDPNYVAHALEFDLAKSVVVVSSKSGSTIETASQRALFEGAFKDAGLNPVDHMVFVTDPGSPLDTQVREGGFTVVNADPHVGGRFSVLSPFGLVPAAVSFAAGVLASMLFKALPLSKVYQAIDWPVVVLLAALIPVAEAMLSTGAAALLAELMLSHLSQGSGVFALILLLILTMTLSDFMNNAATAAVMCPIALSIARQLDVSSDTFLMAVAIGASCAFLTPIGHQNNTLILGPGGFKFGDYWRLGLPLELLVVAVSVPALLYFWPL